MEYAVKVFASNFPSSIKMISMQLVGENGGSDWTSSSGAKSIQSGRESTFTLTSPLPLGKLIYVHFQKHKSPIPNQWFIEKVEVTSPEGEVFKFPIYLSIKTTKAYCFNEGTALTASHQHPLAKHIRESELKGRTEKYCWKEYKKDLPHHVKADEVSHLPSEVRFSNKKDIDFKLKAFQEGLNTVLKNLFNDTKPWKDFRAIEETTKSISNPVTKYVQQHWREDAFFGYQLLNGVNPIIIRRCKSQPKNFPVTNNMGKMKISEEMKKGNIFLCDYKNLDGAETGRINGKTQYLAAPLVLLHKNSAGELKPIAIQLKQTAGEDNPIFLPTDSEYDWLLAKTFVRSAVFNEHQLNAHLLRTHLLAEVFTVSLLRNVPRVHPLYKLLVPHTRFTLQINLLARQSLISENGVFTKYTALSEKGMIKILQRSMKAVTYKSLCIKEDIEERGMGSVPNYHYRDDGSKLWDIIERFVKGVVTHYYKTDKQLKEDPDLQKYIKDIFEHGFGSEKTSGIPQKFSKVSELVKFATMVIFTGSAQHAAVNNGQFDFGAWMPNTPTSLQLPPPTKKGEATEKTLLDTFPDSNTTANAVSVQRLLSAQSSDFVPLGQFPNEHFTEDVPKKLMNVFHNELKKLEADIDLRNSGLKLPYTYLKPSLVENSVSI